MKILFIKYVFLLMFTCFLTNKSLSLDMINLRNGVKTSGVYCIENTITKEKYVGASNDMYRRRVEHLSWLRNGNHSNKKLQSSYNKGKEEDFKFSILLHCLPNHLLKLEKFYIKELNAEYNNVLDFAEKDELTYREKLRESAIARWKVPGYKEQIIAGSIKAVEQLNLETGEVIKEFSSISEASRITNIHIEAIGNTCRGTTFTAGRFRWRFKGEEEKGSSTWKKKVIAKDKKTLEVIGEYNSIKEASEKTGCRRPAISDCLAGRNKSSKGLLWNYKT